MTRYLLRARPIGWCLAFLLLTPSLASAHSDLRLGPFAAGILHPLQTPSQLLLLLALSLLLTQNRPLRLKKLFALFGALVGVSLVAGEIFVSWGRVETISFGLALALGSLVWMEQRVSVKSRAILLVLSALNLGMDSTPPSLGLLVGGEVLFASWVSLLLIPGYLTFYLAQLPHRPWNRSGLRIAGSWIVILALLGLALALKTGT